jgi:hypothetical protein
VAAWADAWKKTRLITGREKDAIVNCASAAPIP